MLVRFQQESMLRSMKRMRRSVEDEDEEELQILEQHQYAGQS